MVEQATTCNDKREWPQSVAFVLFCVTSVQLALLKTFVPVIPGLRVDVYSGILCALTLSFATITAKPRSIRASWPELTVSFALVFLAALSGVFSATKWSSLAWAFSWSANAIGGFWAARIVLDTDFRKKVFVWVCAATVYVLMMLGLWGFYFHGMSQYFVDDLHQLVNIILLMSFASIALISTRKLFPVVAGLSVLLASYGALYVSGIGGVEAAILIPSALLVPGIILMLFKFRGRLGFIILGLLFLGISAHYVIYVSGERFQTETYQQDRIEFYPFSAHIAEKSPLFGIGLRTPREAYLDDYELRYTRQTDEQFAEGVKRLVTSQNIFLTFMVGFGIPFAILYVIAIVYLMIKLFKAVLHPPDESVIPPVALLIAISAGILHYCMMDILIQPQIAWFFHILLALIPTSLPKTREFRIPLRKLLVGTAALLLILIVAVLITTQPTLRTKFPFIAKAVSVIKGLPVISILVSPRPYQKTSKSIPTGWLEVNLTGYVGFQNRWAVMCLLDNSTQMMGEASGWNPNRMTSANLVFNFLCERLTENSVMSARGFVDEGPFTRRGKEYRFRVSHPVIPWIVCPTTQKFVPQIEVLAPGPTNLCPAIESVLKRDFFAIDESLKPRLLIITDISWDCPAKPALNIIKTTDKTRPKPVIDCIFLGPEKDQPCKLEPLVNETGGFMLYATSPETLASGLDQYVEILQTRTFDPIILVNNRRKIQIQPGSFNEIPAGTYDLIVPPTYDLDETLRTISEVSVAAGEGLTLQIEVGKDGTRIVEASEIGDLETARSSEMEDRR